MAQFLCNGLEQDMVSRWEAAKAAGCEGTAEGDNREVDAITRASGKMLLLHKLLPKLRAEGRQVGDTSAAGVTAICSSSAHHSGLWLAVTRHVVCAYCVICLVPPGADLQSVQDHA